MNTCKYYENTRGQSVVETALVLPLIILILAGIIDFGLLFNNYLVISNASREAARLAAVGASDSAINSSIINAARSLDQNLMTVTITPSQSSRKKGDEISVLITYNNRLMTPVISAIVPNPVQLRSRTVMRME
ncbi:MAG: pilus assembly protein [Clostridia bacterium]|nr:pilus assembly protein [Clostridia bacterium]